jgi:beta-lactamase superfamily II metal-dependent hydrolase
VEVLCLAPAEPLLTETDSPTNDNSLALLLTYGDTRLLLCGDQEEAGIQALLEWAEAYEVSLAADAVLLPHHGRSFPWCEELLARSRASWWLVSGRGRRLEGLPELAQRKLLRTGDEGAIHLVSEGREWRVETILGGPAPRP